MTSSSTTVVLSCGCTMKKVNNNLFKKYEYRSKRAAKDLIQVAVLLEVLTYIIMKAALFIIGSRRSVSCLRDAEKRIHEDHSGHEHAASPGSPGDTAMTFLLTAIKKVARS